MREVDSHLSHIALMFWANLFVERVSLFHPNMTASTHRLFFPQDDRQQYRKLFFRDH